MRPAATFCPSNCPHDFLKTQNYDTAKKSGSASLVGAGGWFDGDYKSFSEKRREYLKDDRGFESASDARETFKSFLLPEQLSAWVKCKGDRSELAAYYKNVDERGATVVVTWSAPATVGALKKVSFQFDGAAVTPEMRQTRTLNGTKTFLVRRSGNAPIRGSVAGAAGANNEDRSADIYIPRYDKPKSDAAAAAPEHLIVPIDGRILRSRASWAHGRNSHEWTCLAAPAGFELIDVEVQAVSIGLRRGACVGPGPYCNSLNEHCTEFVIKRGCFVSSQWHDWYVAAARRNGIPYSKDAACRRAASLS